MAGTYEVSVEEYISDMEHAFQSYGYYVSGKAIPGEEALWLSTLREALKKVESVMAFHAKRYGFRGKSKKALACLLVALPEPTWGVEVDQLRK